MVICGNEISSEKINQIKNMIAENQQISRRQLSQQVCELFNWRSPNGKLKDMSCRVALLKLRRQGIIKLPRGYERPFLNSGKNYGSKLIPEMPEIKCNLSELGEIRIIRVSSRYSKNHHIWKEMMGHYHYLGGGPLCGHQMKYLIESNRYGYVGGFAFSSAAWRLEVRDNWIGWDDRTRIKNLSRIVCNSRFLIVPYVKVKNLASYALSLCVRQLKENWHEQYNIKPVVLETFVERDRFKGSSYQAANWMHIGSTKGRGRQDRNKEFGEPVKDIYLYPLDKNYREELCEGTPREVARKKVAIDWVEKESYKWLKSFKATEKTQRRCAETTLISVGDREADIYEFFHLALSKAKGPKLLIRAEYNRLLADGQGKLHEHISSQESAGIQLVRVARKGKQPARAAKLEIRFAEVKLKPPQDKKELGELSVFAIAAEEIEVPEGVKGLRWILLTTCEVKTFEQAIEKLQWYCIRWGIEICHRTLKSGCKIEQRQLGNADRIETCLAIDMVIAWRIYHLTKLGREVPDLPCTVSFEDAEWKALIAYKTQNPIPPEKPPTLREAIHMVASLGGFLGRKCDGEPGTQTLWLGLQRLDDMTEMLKVFMSKSQPYSLRSPPVSRP